MLLNIPAQLAASCRQTRERAAWLERLPAIVAALMERWSLTLLPPLVGGEGTCSWIAPVKRVDGSSALLKLSMPHMEGRDEIPGLRFWSGSPTVKLFESDEEVGAMLLERCLPGTSLREDPEPEQDLVVAGLLRRLWRVPPARHPFRPLSTLTEYWRECTLTDADRWSDAGLVREGLRLLDELPRTAPAQVLLATDLHAGNILRAEREPWLVIDPKPFVGDPAFDATQHLFNCRERLVANPVGVIRRLADLLDVKQERVRLWMIARAAAEPRDDWLDPARDWIAKALLDS